MPNVTNRTSNKSQPFTLKSLFIGSSLSGFIDCSDARASFFSGEESTSLSGSIDCSDVRVFFSSEEALISVEEPSELDWTFELSRSSFIVGDNLVPAKSSFSE